MNTGPSPKLRARLEAAKVNRNMRVTAAELTATLIKASGIMNTTPEEVLRRECERSKINIDHPERRSTPDAATVCGYQLTDQEVKNLNESVSFWMDLIEEANDPILRAEWHEREAEKRKLWDTEATWE